MTVAATEVPTRASVVIIGGGVMGLSTAYHLARAGVADVRSPQASGSSCGSSRRPATPGCNITR
ncbi:FAD-dependent oxidoreductase [Nocardioides limicola]|uniref:FAD-dependent oxidoreductase n=1 Tax=Nocardioides limicola TaxID=2803368 RepID=UPI00193BDB25|nr:FAD-dependent oxidoreductase [Nocardioides sp. DJM-14]